MKLSKDETEILEVIKSIGGPINTWDLLQEIKLRGLHWDFSELGMILSFLKAGRLITWDENGTVSLTILK